MFPDPVRLTVHASVHKVTKEMKSIIKKAKMQNGKLLRAAAGTGGEEAEKSKTQLDPRGGSRVTMCVRDKWGQGVNGAWGESSKCSWQPEALSTNHGAFELAMVPPWK